MIDNGYASAVHHATFPSQGPALDLPLPDARFDLAWTENVAVHIANRERFGGEARRVLKPGGRLAIQDVTQDPGGALHYPVNWAEARRPSVQAPRRGTVSRQCWACIFSWARASTKR